MLNSVQIRDLSFRVRKYLKKLDEQIEMQELDITQYEELDSRLQVVEVFLDSVQSIAKSKKQLS